MLINTSRFCINRYYVNGFLECRWVVIDVHDIYSKGLGGREFAHVGDCKAYLVQLFDSIGAFSINPQLHLEGTVNSLEVFGVGTYMDKGK